MFNPIMLLTTVLLLFAEKKSIILHFRHFILHYNLTVFFLITLCTHRF